MWNRKDKIQRLQQPVGKQYSYEKGPEHSSEHEEIVAYSIADKKDTSLDLDKLNQLSKQEKMLLQSKQSSVYTSFAYQEAIKGKGIT